MIAGENINELIDLMDEYDIKDNNTVAEYKYKAYFKYLINNNLQKPSQILYFPDY